MKQIEHDWIDKFIRHLEFERRLSSLICQIDIAQVEADQFAKPQSRRIQQLKNCTVSNDDRLLSTNIQKPRHAIGVQVSRQTFAGLRRANRNDGVLLDVLFAMHVPVKSPGRRQATLNAACTQSLSVTSGGKSTHVFVIELFPFRHAVLIAILSEGVEVSLIMFAGQTRKTALELQMPDKLIYPVVTLKETFCSARKRTRSDPPL